MSLKEDIVKLADHLDKIGLLDEADVLDSVLVRLYNNNLVKIACIVAAGNFNGKKCLLKNRDRAYKPKIKIYHQIINGVEILYLRDEITDWCEGMNQFGVGIVNSTLDVIRDEKEGTKKEEKEIKKEKEIHKKEDDEKQKPHERFPKNRQRMVAALSQNSLADTIKYITLYKDGLRGHNIVANSEATYMIEAPDGSKRFNVQLADEDEISLRTNHGKFFKGVGYTKEKNLAGYNSSMARYEQATMVLNDVEAPEDIAPAIYRERKEDRKDPNNMVKDTDVMKTTSQMVLNLSDLEAYLYILPGKVDFLGYETSFPEGYIPKIKLKVFRYTEIKKDNSFDVIEIKPEEYSKP